MEDLDRAHEFATKVRAAAHAHLLDFCRAGPRCMLPLGPGGMEEEGGCGGTRCASEVQGAASGAARPC